MFWWTERRWTADTHHLSHLCLLCNSSWPPVFRFCHYCLILARRSKDSTQSHYIHTLTSCSLECSLVTQDFFRLIRKWASYRMLVSYHQDNHNIQDWWQTPFSAHSDLVTCRRLVMDFPFRTLGALVVDVLGHHVNLSLLHKLSVCKIHYRFQRKCTDCRQALSTTCTTLKTDVVFLQQQQHVGMFCKHTWCWV